jgi:hypothetical protein
MEKLYSQHVFQVHITAKPTIVKGIRVEIWRGGEELRMYPSGGESLSVGVLDVKQLALIPYRTRKALVEIIQPMAYTQNSHLGIHPKLEHTLMCF